MKKEEAKTNRPHGTPELWLEEYGDYLYRYALLRVHNAKTAEDLVQETFLAALSALNSFSGKSSQKTWLVGILKHKIVDFFRKSSRETAVEDMELAASEPAEDAFDAKGHWRVKPAEWTVSPTAALEQREFFEVLQHCLNGLPERLCRAFTLREMEDMSSEEICKVLDISPTNLWVILHRARNKLKKCLETKWLAESRNQDE